MSQFLFCTQFENNKLSWQSSYMYYEFDFSSENIEYRISGGLLNPDTRKIKKIKLLKKKNFLFYEEDPSAKRTPKKVLKLEMPIAQISELKCPRGGFTHVLILKKGSEIELIYINRPEIWKKLIRLDVIWNNFEDEFTEVKSLGKGAFGHVSLVRNNISGKLFASKYIPIDQILRTNQINEMISNEIKNLKVIDHQNIPKLDSCYINENYLVMMLEYVEGQSLYEYLKNYQKNSREDKIHSYKIKKWM